MIKLNRHPANPVFDEPYASVRNPPGGDLDLVARARIRAKFPQGFTEDAYADDPAAQSFNSSGGSVAGLGMYGRDLVITGDRRKLSFFARGNANRFGIAHTPGALMGLADYKLTDDDNGNTALKQVSAPPVMQMDPIDITGYIRPPCPPGYREVSTANGQVCITDQKSNSGSTLDSAIDSVKSFFKGIFSGGSTAPAVSAATSDPSEWANPFPDRSAAASLSAPPLVQAGPSAFASLGTVGRVGLALGGVGVVYGLVKHKPKIAVAAAAVGVAALVLPKLMGVKGNPFAA